MPKKTINPKTTEAVSKNEPASVQAETSSQTTSGWRRWFSKRWVLIGVGLVLLLVIATIVYFVSKSKQPETAQPNPELYAQESEAAQTAFSEGDNFAAFTHYEVVVANAPADEKPALLLITGRLAFLIGEYDKAINYLGQAAESATNENDRKQAEFYKAEAEHQKQAKEAYDAQQYDDTGSPPEKSELYEQL